MDSIKNYLRESITVKKSILDNVIILNKLKDSSDVIVKRLNIGAKIMLAGNGGSASDSQHIAAEFVSKFAKSRPSLAAISLNVDTSVLTAVSNDFGYEEVFSRQIEALGKKNDIFWAFSTSGNSKNVIKALKTAKKMGIFTIFFTSEKACLNNDLADIIIKVPSINTPIIQEIHISLGHLLCKLVEDNIFFE